MGDELEGLTFDELTRLADRAGVLVLEDSTTPDILRTRIRRSML